MRSRIAATNVEEEGRALVERLGGRWGPGGGLCRCPAHDDRTPSLSVRPGRSRLLLKCFGGCETKDVLRAIGAAGHPLGRPVEAEALERRGRGAGAGPRLALRLWGEARSLEGSPAQAYLSARGIGSGDRELRYHPRAPHGSGPSVRFRPAMVAAVRDETGLVAVHRTFLDRRGSALAPIDAPRRGLGRFGSGAVRLGGVAPLLGLAEGVETALSASLLFSMPCWALLGAERFGKVALPPAVRGLVLFLDHDSGGRRAEALARDAWAALVVEARRPSRAGADWNDVLRAARASAP